MTTSRASRAIVATALALGFIPALGCCSLEPLPSEDRPERPGEAYVIELDPPEDRELSPYTGWTRAHHEAVFGRMLLGWVDHLEPGRARTNFEGGASMPAAMEGVTRMLAAIGAWLADPANPSVVVVEGRSIDLVAIGRDAIVHGTDPDHDEYWGAMVEGWDQRKVEAAEVARFLVLSRTRVWDQLSDEERARIGEWLTPAEAKLPGNWSSFLLARNVARHELGLEHDQEGLVTQLDELESDYRGDGWYQDSTPERFDYYDAFVFHPGLLFWADHMGDQDPERRERLHRRTAAFLDHFRFFFAADGAPVAFGRSLAYRMALVEPVVAAHESGISPLSPGQSRRLASGAMRHFVGERPSDTGRMLDEDHVLRRGWIDDDPRVLESYVRPGSQYFAAHGLRALAIPRDDPFWTEVEAPLPADEGPFEHAIGSASLAIEHHPDTGVVLRPALLEWGKASQFHRYSKFAYGSHFFFHTSEEGEPEPYDASVVVSSNASFNARRGSAEAGAVTPGFAFTRFRVPDEVLMANEHVLDTFAFAFGEGSVRVTCVDPAAGEPRVFAGAPSVAFDEAPEERGGENPPWAYLGSPSGAALIASLHGFDQAGTQLGQADASNQNAVHPQARHPALATSEGLSTETCFASWELFRLAAFEPELEFPSADAIEEGRIVHVEHGGLEAWVRAGEELESTQVEIAGRRFVGPLRFARSGPSGFSAVGVERVENLEGELLVDGLASAGVLDCSWPDEATLRCTIDGPATLHHPDTQGVVVIGLGGERIDVSDDIELGGPSVTIDESLFDRERRERSRLVVELGAS